MITQHTEISSVCRKSSGWVVSHVDEFIEELLTEELVCDIALPHLVKRNKLEEMGVVRT
jgi:pre-mRNA-splicing factor 38A